MDAARGLRIRIAVIASGILVVLFWMMASGNESVILVEFGIAPEVLEGAQVFIDDEAVGELKRMGARTQTGFKVKDGDHTIRLEVEGYGSKPTRVTSGFGGAEVRLMADFESGRDDETTIVLMR